MTMGLVGEHASEVGPDEQTGDTDVAAEELVAHRHHAHVVAAELVDERREDPRAVLPRQDRDRRVSPRQERDGARRLHDTRRAVALGRSAVDPREEPRRDAGGLVDEAVHLELEGARHADAVFVHREALVRIGARGRDDPRASSTRRRGTRRAGRAHARKTCCQRATRGRRRRRASSAVCERSAGSVDQRLTPSGTMHSDASSGYRSSTPASVRSSSSPSFTSGHTTTWPCTVMPASSNARSQRRLVAPRRLRSIRARSSGSVVWMLTFSGLSFSVMTRSRSASVNRVSVV